MSLAKSLNWIPDQWTRSKTLSPPVYGTGVAVGTKVGVGGGAAPAAGAPVPAGAGVFVGAAAGAAPPPDVGALLPPAGLGASVGGAEPPHAARATAPPTTPSAPTKPRRDMRKANRDDITFLPLRYLVVSARPNDLPEADHTQAPMDCQARLRRGCPSRFCGLLRSHRALPRPSGLDGPQLTCAPCCWASISRKSDGHPKALMSPRPAFPWAPARPPASTRRPAPPLAPSSRTVRARRPAHRARRAACRAAWRSRRSPHRGQGPGGMPSLCSLRVAIIRLAASPPLPPFCAAVHS